MLKHILCYLYAFCRQVLATTANKCYDITVETNKENFMTAGTVKFFNTTKGFGFITPDDGGNDVFVHITALGRAGIEGHQLSDGAKVSYEVETRNGKTSAVNIQLL